MSLATVASVVGIGAGLNSFLGGSGGGGSSGGGSNTSQYIPTGQGGADQIWRQMLQSLSGGAGGAAGAINPQLLQAFKQMMGVDPSGMTGAAQQQGAYTGNLAANEDAMHNILSNQAGVNMGAQQNLMGAGNQLFQTSLDPQNALRDKLQQQVTDASRAGTSARGIGMSGNAAGIESNDVGNFLMNWENQQLGRQSQGLQGMTGAYQQAGQQGQNVGANLTGAAGLGTMAAGNIGASGMDPYLAMLMGAQQPFNAANAYTGAQGGVNNQYSGVMSQIMPYLNYGINSSNNAFGQQQTGLNNLATGLQQFGGQNPFGMLGSIYGGQNLGQYNNPSANTNQGSNWSGSADPYGGMAYPM